MLREHSTNSVVQIESDEAAARCARGIQIQLVRRNFEAAHDLIESFERECVHPRDTESDVPDDVREIPLAQTGLSVRNLNRLERAGVVFVGDLLDTPPDYLLGLRGVGMTFVGQVTHALLGLGIVWPPPSAVETGGDDGCA